MTSKLAIYFEGDACVTNLRESTVQTCMDKKQNTKTHAFVRLKTFVCLEDKPLLKHWINAIIKMYADAPPILTFHYNITKVCEIFMLSRDDSAYSVKKVTC